jgi:asparagine synthase (glutamine-hydrolysing)
MCGIAGIYDRPGEIASRDLLLRMAASIRHRGPDGTGLYLCDSYGMVNTRLSIVDLEGGDQPIPNEDSRYWVMQNGEIYNAPELRAELERLGHEFRTTCDTEVLVHAYEEWGPKCLDRLNGAFAFAVWDHLEERLFLARDRFGIRPLFLARVEGALLFASEVKALFCHPQIVRELDPLSLAETFTLWACAPDRSAFAGIHELPPGHYMILGPDRSPEVHRWWDVEFSPSSRWRTESEEALADELLDLLEDATRLRLRADVPVGAYLSGGLDSSATAAIVRKTSAQPLTSFALSFADANFDESEFQQVMADRLGTDLHSIRIKDADIAEVFPEVVRLAEKTLLRTAPAPLFLLSRLVRQQGLKVVLTGEGADEVFGGYNIFRESKVRRFWARNPESRFRHLLLGRLYPFLAQGLSRAGGFQKAFFAKGLTETDDPLYSHRIRFANTSRCNRFLTKDYLEQGRNLGDPEVRLRQRLPDAFQEFPPLGQAQYLEITTFLQGYLLHSQGDRMLMGNSIEGRFPFLDHRLAEFAVRVPDTMRIKALREKHLLRKAVQGMLPKEIGSRPKRPYRAPILRAFIGQGSPEWVSELTSPSQLADAGIFDAKMVGQLKSKCQKNLESGISETDEMALVGILSTMLLRDAFITDFVAPPPDKPCRVAIRDRVVETTDHA